MRKDLIERLNEDSFPCGFEGPISAGKTSVTKRLCKDFDVFRVMEDADHPLLAVFYKAADEADLWLAEKGVKLDFEQVERDLDKVYAYFVTKEIDELPEKEIVIPWSVRQHFLAIQDATFEYRPRDLRNAFREHGNRFIADRTPPGDFVYCTAMWLHNKVTTEEYLKMITRLEDVVGELKRDGMMFKRVFELTCSPEKAYERKFGRGRATEATIPFDYFRLLDRIHRRAFVPWMRVLGYDVVEFNWEQDRLVTQIQGHPESSVLVESPPEILAYLCRK